MQQYTCNNVQNTIICEICAADTIFEKSHRHFFTWEKIPPEKIPLGKNPIRKKWETFPMGKISHGKI